MWQKIFFCAVFIIPMVCIEDATSQRTFLEQCGQSRCGYLATCFNDRCICNSSSEENPSRIFKENGPVYCKKGCNNGEGCLANTTCVSHRGYHLCECTTGFSLSPIGQCLANCEMTPCGPNMTCTTTAVPKCQCRSEYGRNSSGHCIHKCDLIQCMQGTACSLSAVGNPICQSPCEPSTCDKNATCHYNGYVTCRCKPGFTKDATTSCVAQCEIKPCGPNMICNVSAVGGPTCQCRSGYMNSSGHCLLMCEMTLCGPNMTCNMNAVGGPTCQCRPGYRRNSSGHCIPITTSRTATVVVANGTTPNIQTTLTEISTTYGVTKSTMRQDEGQINTGFIVAAVITTIVAIAVICVIIYAFCRYRKRHKRPTDIPLESSVGSSRTDSVTGRHFRGSSSSLDIAIKTRVIVENRNESSGKQRNDGSPNRTKVQVRSSEYDPETLYGNGKIPENKRLASENKNDHPDNLYSNSSVAENKRRAMEDKAPRDVTELSPFDEYSIFGDGDQPRYNTLAETGFAKGLVVSKNSPLSVSPDFTAEAENDCDYNHLRLKVL